MRFHVKEAGADAKLTQHGPIGVAYHHRHPISTVPVARITAHAMVPSQDKLFLSRLRFFISRLFSRDFVLSRFLSRLSRQIKIVKICQEILTLLRHLIMKKTKSMNKKYAKIHLDSSPSRSRQTIEKL